MIEKKNELIKQLQKGADFMSVALSEQQETQLLNYIVEFHKWNQAYNLSAVRDLESMVARHLLDSLSVVPFFNRSDNVNLKSIADVGTGGGLPGVPLAIMFPEKKFTLVDSNGKKTRFLIHIKNLLNLTNISVENKRVEQVQPEELFDAVISRAFASLEDMTSGCAHLINSSGFFLAMKGLFPADELKPIESQVRLIETLPLTVAETDGERHLLVLKKLP